MTISTSFIRRGLSGWVYDPVLDAEGRDKPRDRRGAHTTDLSNELTSLIGRRVVAYRDRKTIITRWGGIVSPTEYHYEDTDYIFVEGYPGRLTSKNWRENGIYATPDAIIGLANKIRVALSREEATGERAEAAARKEVLTAIVGAVKNDENGNCLEARLANIKETARVDAIVAGWSKNGLIPRTNP